MGEEWRGQRERRMVIGDCLPKLQLLAVLPTILTQALLIQLKETPRCFYFLGEISILKINREIAKP